MERAKLIRAVRAAQRGDREAVELLYNEWSGRLTAFICRQTGTDRAPESQWRISDRCGASPLRTTT